MGNVKFWQSKNFRCISFYQNIGIESEFAKKIEARTATLERSPKADLLDLSTEELGFFKLGDKVIETFFPR